MKLGNKTQQYKLANINDTQSPYYLCAFNILGNAMYPITFTRDKYANRSRLVTNELKSKKSSPLLMER